MSLQGRFAPNRSLTAKTCGKSNPHGRTNTQKTPQATRQTEQANGHTRNNPIKGTGGEHSTSSESPSPHTKGGESIQPGRRAKNPKGHRHNPNSGDRQDALGTAEPDNTKKPRPKTTAKKTNANGGQGALLTTPPTPVLPWGVLFINLS